MKITKGKTEKLLNVHVGTTLPSGNRVVSGPHSTVLEAKNARKAYFATNPDRNIYDAHVEAYGDNLYVTIK